MAKISNFHPENGNSSVCVVELIRLMSDYCMFKVFKKSEKHRHQNVEIELTVI